MTRVLFLANVQDPHDPGIVFGKGSDLDLDASYDAALVDWRAEGKISMPETVEPLEVE